MYRVQENKNEGIKCGTKWADESKLPKKDSPGLSVGND
jgi:hypothetical protein